MAPPLRILVVDDHAIVRQGLKLLINNQPDMAVVGEAADGNAALEQAESLNPDVAVMDISMPGMSGLSATRTLKQQQPAVSIVALTRHDDDAYIEELLRAGASAYVLKHSPPTEFLKAIRVVAAGGIYIDPAMRPRVADGILARPVDITRAASATLTERESEVLRLVAVGYTNLEIANRLKISAKTVEVHKANAMRKLGLTGRVDVIRYAALQGWLYDT